MTNAITLTSCSEVPGVQMRCLALYMPIPAGWETVCNKRADKHLIISTQPGLLFRRLWCLLRFQVLWLLNNLITANPSNACAIDAFNL